jgi:predicted dithiol-disulfide oxidoreductase (DUF899 family)
MIRNLDLHKIVSQEEWIEARKRLLTQEKESTRLSDRLSQQRKEQCSGAGKIGAFFERASASSHK